MSEGGPFAVGEEVQITGGLFAGQTGRVEEVLPSGKLQVRVETSRSVSRARVDPAHATALSTSSDALGSTPSGESPAADGGAMEGLERWDEQRNGTPTEKALRQKLEERGYRAARYVYAPGTFFPEHTHATDKIDAVVSGRFRMIVEGREVILEAGDTLAVPRGTRHSAAVVGDEPVVSLDAVPA